MRVHVLTGAIGAVELHLQAVEARGPGGGRGEFDKARRGGGRDQRVMGRDVPFEVRSPQPSMLGHPRGGEHGGSSHGVLPEGLGNPCIGVGAGLTPVLKLACSLVELVVGVHRGLDLHCRASKSWGSFHKDDCRPLKIEIHAGWSEAHDCSRGTGFFSSCTRLM